MAKVPSIPARHIFPGLLAAGVEWVQSLIRAVNGHDDSLATKADIVSGATAGNLPTFTAAGNIQDSGKVPPAGAIVGTTDAQTLANKTLTKPAIGDFFSAQHDHGAATGGGALGGVDGVLSCIVAIEYLASGGVQYKTQAFTFDNGGMLTQIGSISSWTIAASV